MTFYLSSAMRFLLSTSKPSILKCPTIANAVGDSPVSPWVPSILVPILICPLPQTHIWQLSDTIWVSYDSTQFRHCVPGDSIRSHTLGAQSYKTCFPPSDTNRKSRLSPVLLTYWPWPTCGVELFARASRRNQRNILLTRLPIYYKRM